MTNKEQLKKLIETYVTYATGGVAHIDDEAMARMNLHDFIDGLNLDPVLETYEQAGRRCGFIMREGPAAKNVAFKSSPDTDIAVDTDDWKELCTIIGIERQIIDGSKVK